MCILKISPEVTSVRRRRQPLRVRLPPPPNTSSNKTMTLFWCAVSAASTFASVTSLRNMDYFSSLTHPFSHPYLLIFGATVLSVGLHLVFVFNHERNPTIYALSLAIIHGLVDAFGYCIKFVSLVYPQKDSEGLGVFVMAVSVDYFASMKMPGKDMDLFDHAIFAMARVCRMCFFHGRKEFSYSYGPLGAFVMYRFFQQEY